MCFAPLQCPTERVHRTLLPMQCPCGTLSTHLQRIDLQILCPPNVGQDEYDNVLCVECMKGIRATCNPFYCARCGYISCTACVKTGVGRAEPAFYVAYDGQIVHSEEDTSELLPYGRSDSRRGHKGNLFPHPALVYDYQRLACDISFPPPSLVQTQLGFLDEASELRLEVPQKCFYFDSDAVEFQSCYTLVSLGTPPRKRKPPPSLEPPVF